MAYKFYASRKQRNMSLNYDQAVFIMKNHLQMSYSEMARHLNISFNMVIVNAKIMGVQCKPIKKDIVIDRSEPVRWLDLDNGKGYFDLNKWGRAYAI